MNRLALLLATWFGCGYFPWGPGTAGSLAAVIVAGALHYAFDANRGSLAILVAVFLVPGIWAAGKAAHLTGKEDPGLVVVDEVLGQWVALFGPAVLNVKILVLGFLLFRLFDIWKPWPIRKLEHLPGGVGIVTDDLAAGVYASLILYIGRSVGL